jgi:hypothetical protein
MKARQPKGHELSRHEGQFFIASLGCSSNVTDMLLAAPTHVHFKRMTKTLSCSFVAIKATALGKGRLSLNTSIPLTLLGIGSGQG